jgi:hypothetical protein
MMSKTSRAYQAGDYVHINHLYKKVTGTIRSADEYTWEWLETWDGPGSVWLTFDDSREPEDQLIGQYSLIPTPFSFWGNKYLAGKTENCMSHPDFRGKGMYFYHEKKYFEEAKKRFQLFFTTTGDVARGAPGKVRMKLGYRAFDHWVTYSYWLSRTDLKEELKSKLPGFIKKIRPIASILATVIGKGILWHSKSNRSNHCPDIQRHGEVDAPLSQIEALWGKNAELYGISVDRSETYLKWRINDNPYQTHYYLTHSEEDTLKGYLIFGIQDKIIHIIDVIADSKSEVIFKALFEKLIAIGKDEGFSQVKCYTASKNMLLTNMLQKSKFINWAEITIVQGFKKQIREPQIFVYVDESVDSMQDHWDGQNWYLTDLVKEGRPYVGRAIG